MDRPDPFIYIPPDNASVAKIRALRESCAHMRDLLMALAPDCRERSLAITKLEEVSMWGNAAIVRTQASDG